MPPEDGQELMPKNIGAIINKNIAQQFDIQYYKCLISFLSSCPYITLHFPDSLFLV
jgi:hypothetical protein